MNTLSDVDHKLELLLRQNEKILSLLSKHFAEVLTKEDTIIMAIDVVKDMAAQVDDTLTVMANSVAEIQKDLANLASIPADNTAAIEAQIARLKTGTDALAASLPAPTVVVAPVTPVVAPAPTPDAPVSPAAPADATVGTVVQPVPGAAA